MRNLLRGWRTEMIDSRRQTSGDRRLFRLRRNGCRLMQKLLQCSGRSRTGRRHLLSCGRQERIQLSNIGQGARSGRCRSRLRPSRGLIV